jgi:aspartate/methionine/tyrosine aminotransferase
MSSSTRIANRFQQTGPSSAEIWAKLRAFAGQPGIINLGQGFPDFTALPEAIDHAKKALDTVSLNQYASMGGALRLKSALSNFYGQAPPRNATTKDTTTDDRTFFNPNTEITVTTSGTEAVYCTMQAIVNPGDQVIVFEPSFPWYVPAIKLAGGIPICIELQPPHFSLLQEETLATLLSHFNKADGSVTPKLIVLNSPHNPTGHIITNEELDIIEELCLKHECLVVSDEVYERCVFDGHEMSSIRNRQNMASKTITIGSASKLLSMTGWRIGWCVGPADIICAIKVSSGYTTFAAPTPLQDACAAVLETAIKDQNLTFGNVASLFFNNFCKLKTCLENVINLVVCECQGGYFLTADVSSTGMNDLIFVEHLVQSCKVAALPMRLFYSDPSEPRNLVRFAICKKMETIDATINAITTFYNNKK